MSKRHHPSTPQRTAFIEISERFKNIEESRTSSATYLIWVLSKRALFPAKQYWAINKVMHPIEKQTSGLLQEKNM